MLYNYISKIPKKEQFYYVFVMAFAIYFVAIILKIQFSQVIGILFGVFLIYYFNDRSESLISGVNKELEFKLNTIKNTVLGMRISRSKKRKLVGRVEQSPRFFYVDADIINLVFNINDFAVYNPESYSMMIKCIDNVLQLHENIKTGVSRCAENIETMEMYKDKAINYYHTFIFSLPSIKVVNQKFQRNIDRLQLLLQRHIDDVFKICEKQTQRNGYSSDTKILYNFKGMPKPNRMNDPGYSKFDFY